MNTAQHQEKPEIIKRLLNDFQQDFPLCSRPYAEIASQLGMSEQDVIQHLKDLSDEGCISRVGPVLRPNSIGVSTLAAMAVPLQRLESVAELINDYAEVNHNYEREHAFNLWFVINADDQPALEHVIADITARTGIAVMNLPMETSFHIDLGFKLKWNEQ